jgi:hypothetical protein
VKSKNKIIVTRKQKKREEKTSEEFVDECGKKVAAFFAFGMSDAFS